MDCNGYRMLCFWMRKMHVGFLVFKLGEAKKFQQPTRKSRDTSRALRSSLNRVCNKCPPYKHHYKRLQRNHRSFSINLTTHNHNPTNWAKKISRVVLPPKAIKLHWHVWPSSKAKSFLRMSHCHQCFVHVSNKGFRIHESVEPLDSPEHLEACRPRLKWQHVPSCHPFEKFAQVKLDRAGKNKRNTLRPAKVNHFLLNAQVNFKHLLFDSKLQLPVPPKNSFHNLHVWFHHFRTL